MARPRSVRWRWRLFAAYAIANVALIAAFRVWLLPFSADWQQWEALSKGLATGSLYDLGTELPYVYSPVIAPLLALVPVIGFWPWLALHLVAVIALRDRLLIALTLVSWAFWTDAMVGNVLTFVFCAGALALRGSRVASLVYIVLLTLMPRPVQIPLGAWLLWKMPDIRLPAAVLFGVHATAVWESGYAMAWIEAMLSFAEAPEFNMSPTWILGLAWLAIGIPLGLWLTTRGRIGWAGLAISPYVLPAYLLFPLLDLRNRQAPATTRAACSGDLPEPDSLADDLLSSRETH